MKSDLHKIKQLIADFAQADADHAAAFDQPDGNEACDCAVDKMDAAFLALCMSKPSCREGASCRTSFISHNLFELTEGRPVYRRRVFAALDVSPVDKSNNGEN